MRLGQKYSNVSLKRTLVPSSVSSRKLLLHSKGRFRKHRPLKKTVGIEEGSYCVSLFDTAYIYER